MNYKIIDMKVFGDERGKLVSFEKGINCPFEVKNDCSFKQAILV